MDSDTLAFHFPFDVDERARAIRAPAKLYHADKLGWIAGTVITALAVMATHVWRLARNGEARIHA